MKSFTGDFIWSSVEHGRAEADFVEAYGNYDDMQWFQKWHQK